MSTQSDASIQADLDHKYLNVAITYIGDANGLPASAAAGNLYAALFVGAVEADYGSYVRIAIPRTGSGFSRTNNIMTNVAQINFIKAVSGSNVVTKVAIYDRVTAGVQLHIQTLANPITVTTNVQPIIEAGALTITGS